MSLPKSAGKPASKVPPRLANCACILGSASAALMLVLSRFTISIAVFLGAPTHIRSWSHNLTRVINILGIGPLIAAIRA
jgi:hypothetical protein